MCGDNIEGALTGMCLEDYGYDEVIYLSDDRFLPALVGVTTDNRAVYDYGKIIEILRTEFRLSEQDAVEHADYNFSGVMGEGFPIYTYEVDGMAYYRDAMEKDGNTPTQGTAGRRPARRCSAAEQGRLYAAFFCFSS